MWLCITDFNKDIDLFTVCATAAIRLATVRTQEEINTVNVKSNTLEKSSLFVLGNWHY